MFVLPEISGEPELHEPVAGLRAVERVRREVRLIPHRQFQVGVGAPRRCWPPNRRALPVDVQLPALRKSSSTFGNAVDGKAKGAVSQGRLIRMNDSFF